MSRSAARKTKPAAKSPSRNTGTGATWSKIEGGKGVAATGKTKRSTSGRGRKANLHIVSDSRRTAAGGRKSTTNEILRLPPAVQRQLLALVMGAGGALLLVGLFVWAQSGASGSGASSGGVIGLVGKLLAQLFGFAAWIVPVAVMVGAVRIFAQGSEREKNPEDPQVSVKWLGFALLLLGGMGLLHLVSKGQAAAEAGQGGGYLGLALSTFLSDYLTQWGAGVALLAVIGLGVILAGAGRNRSVQGATEESAEVESGIRTQQGAVLTAAARATVRSARWAAGLLKQVRQPSVQAASGSRGSVVINGELSAVETQELLELEPILGDTRGIAEGIEVESSLAEHGGSLSAPTSGPPEKPGPIINVPKVTKSTDSQNALVAPVVSPFGYVWNLPPLKLLEDVSEVKVSQSDVKAKIKVLEETLLSFNVDAAVREVNTGPAVTQFAIEPGVGVRVNRVTALEKDIALALAAAHIRLEAPIPGQSRIGIEVPNNKLQVVGLRSVMESEAFVGSSGRLKMALGRDTHGRPVTTDLAKLPHLLVAGATGSGKSVFLNSMVIAFLLQFTPDDLRMLMIDPKRVELTPFNGIPHLLRPVVTDIRMEKDTSGPGNRSRGAEGDGTPSDQRALTAVEALKWALWEMERRYKVFSKGVRDKDGINKVFRNIESYRTFHKENPQASMEHLPYIVFIIDELADLMLTAPEEVETSLCRLAQLARATGIHLVVATQRPSVDVVTGLIKANFPARAAFAVSSQVDSKVILDSGGAEKLLGRGDMLYTASDESKPVRIQGVYVSDAESERVVNFWRKQLPEPDAKGNQTPSGGNHQPSQADKTQATGSAYEMQMPDWLGSGDADADSELLEQAIELAKKSEFVSVSMLQRKLRIGYNRSARLVDQMEELGLISPANPDNRGKPREVLLGAPDERALDEEL